MVITRNGIASTDFSKSGVTGIEINYGYIRSDDLSTEWNSRNKYRNIDKMRRTDGMINAILNAHKLLLIQSTKIIEPASNDPFDIEIAEAVEKVIFENPTFDFEIIYNHILKFIDYGFYLFYKGKWYDKKNDWINITLEPRKSETIQGWFQDGKGTLIRIEQFAQIPDGGWQTMSMNNRDMALFTINREGDNYEGESLLRPIWRNFYMKDMLYRLDGIKHERNAIPVPVVKLPEVEQSDDKDDAIEVVENHRSHEKGYVILPHGFEIDFITAKDGQGTNIIDSIKMHNMEMTSAYLANFLNMGNETGGTYNSIEQKADMFMRAVQSTAKLIEDVFNERNEGRAIIRDFVDWNFNNVEKYPKLIHAKIAQRDIEKLATALEKFAMIGYDVVNEETGDMIKDLMGLPLTKTESKTNVVTEKTDIQKEDSTISTQKEKELDNLTDCNCHIKLQDTSFKLSRAMTDFEKNICCVDKIADKLENYKNTVLQTGDIFRKQMIQKLIAKSKTMLVKNTDLNTFVKELNAYTAQVIQGKYLNQGAFTQALLKTLKEVWKYGRDSVQAELARQKVKLVSFDTPEDVVMKEGTNLIKPVIANTVDSLTNSSVVDWKGLMINQKRLNKINTDEIASQLQKLAEAKFKRDLFTNVLQTFGQSRTFESNKIKKSGIDVEIVRSEIMDGKICSACKEIDGKDVIPGTELYDKTINGVYEDCESAYGGKNNCRGINMYISG